MKFKREKKDDQILKQVTHVTLKYIQLIYVYIVVDFVMKIYVYIYAETMRDGV